MDKTTIYESAQPGKSWLSLSIEQKKSLIAQVSKVNGLPFVAIEKDWWVCQCLKALFSSSIKDYLVFKGGTSLSKSWSVIERFSEDIDISIDRRFFDFEGELSKSQIRSLRRKSFQYISTNLLNELNEIFYKMGFSHLIDLKSAFVVESDKDPHILELYYQSIYDSNEYLHQKVIIEIGSRSLKEPYENRIICSEISKKLNLFNSHEDSFLVPSVHPIRTFWEKVFLLHEEFSLPLNKIRVERLSRHLYDLDKLSNSDFFELALVQNDLFKHIAKHRSMFYRISGVDYTKHLPSLITILPPESLKSEYEKDYNLMQEFMIYGTSLSFVKLLESIEKIQNRINHMVF